MLSGSFFSCPLFDTILLPLQLPKPLTSPQSPRQRKRQHTWPGFLAVTADSPSNLFGWSTRRWRRQERTGWQRWKTSPHHGSLWRSRVWRKVGHPRMLFKIVLLPFTAVLFWLCGAGESSRMSYHIITMMMFSIITLPRPVNLSA